MNETKVITGKVRFSYLNVFEPTAIDENSRKTYNVSLIIPKSDTATIDKIKKAIASAKELYKSKLADKNGKLPANLWNPLRDGDIERADSPEYENSFFISAKSEIKPGLVDKDLNPIMSREEMYSGCYGRASISFFGFSASGNKGIACGLNHLQKLSDGEPLGGGSTAEADFGGENAYAGSDDDDLL